MHDNARGCCVVLLLSFVHVIVDVEGVSNTNMLTKYACSGVCHQTEYSRYSMECPLGQKIALDKLQYRWKHPSMNCPNTMASCQNKGRCCHHDSSDCSTTFSERQAYKLYRECSGRQQCGWLEAEALDTLDCPSFRGNAYYVSSAYKCEEDSSFLDMCSNQTLEADSINLIYNGTRMNEHANPNFNRCVCIVSASDCDSETRLRFTAVDIRLQDIKNMSHCPRHSRITFTDKYGNRDYSCYPNGIYRGHDLYYSSSPYARISVDSIAGEYPSQVWLKVGATMPGIKVVVSCGRVTPQSQTFCGPPELIPTTPHPSHPPVSDDDVFGGTGGGYTADPRSPFDDGGGTSSKEQSELPAIIGGSASAAVVLLIIIFAICCIRRRQAVKRRKAKENTNMLPPADFLHHIPAINRPAEGSIVGNYYEFIADTNVNGISDASVVSSPNKVMATFTPGRKQSDQFFPPDLKAPPPPPTPKIEKKPNMDNAGGYYHQPWDNAQPMSNRIKRNDLAYATSDEIQVLIQRMEHDRRCLNEGGDDEQVVPNRSFYIHIDDYKINKTPTLPRSNLNQQADENVDEEEDLKYRYVEDEVEMDEEDEEGEDAEGACNNILKSRPRALKVESQENMCDSEDTGYRSVGSPDQVLVTEDDYLIPGSVKSSMSAESNGKDTLRKSDSSESNNADSVRHSSVFEQNQDDDDNENGRSVNHDVVRTKF